MVDTLSASAGGETFPGGNRVFEKPRACAEVITVPLPDGAGKKTVRLVSLDERGAVAGASGPGEGIAQEVTS
jgi:hypothetical protein